MKKVFVIGEYSSKANYRKYLKIIRKLEKNYSVLSMIDNAKGEDEFKYHFRDLEEVEKADYVVAYIPSSLSSVNASFLAGWAKALNKPILVISSKYSSGTILNCVAKVINYQDDISDKTFINIEDYI